MDFFAQQDIARRNTRLLVLLFLGTVLLLVLVTNVLMAAFLFSSQDYNIYSGHREGVAGFLSYFSWPQFGTIGLGITATVVLVVLAKWMQLSTGGKVVAEGMGAHGFCRSPETLPSVAASMSWKKWHWRPICRCPRCMC